MWLELGLYNPPAAKQHSFFYKEDFAIITTTLDGIVNRINVLSDETSIHTSILVIIIEEFKTTRPRTELSTNPCYTCGKTGHLSPDCPQKWRKLKKRTLLQVWEIRPLDQRLSKGWQRSVCHDWWGTWHKTSGNKRVRPVGEVEPRTPKKITMGEPAKKMSDGEPPKKMMKLSRKNKD